MCLIVDKINCECKLAEEDITVYKYLERTEIPRKNLVHGERFKANIKGIDCEGKISMQRHADSGKIVPYFCTNDSRLKGMSADDKLGFEFSWVWDTSVKILTLEYSREYTTEGYVTPFRKCPIEIGETYESGLEYKYGKVERGIHSLVDLEYLKCKKDGYVIVECIIPKGSYYYKGIFCGALSIASNRITYKKIITI